METISALFKFGNSTPQSQIVSQIVITRSKNRILELPELKEAISKSNKTEHKYYNPRLHKLELLNTSVTKEGAVLSEF